MNSSVSNLGPARRPWSGRDDRGDRPRSTRAPAGHRDRCPTRPSAPARRRTACRRRAYTALEQHLVVGHRAAHELRTSSSESGLRSSGSDVPRPKAAAHRLQRRSERPGPVRDDDQHPLADSDAGQIVQQPQAGLVSVVRVVDQATGHRRRKKPEQSAARRTAADARRASPLSRAAPVATLDLDPGCSARPSSNAGDAGTDPRALPRSARTARGPSSSAATPMPTRIPAGRRAGRAQHGGLADPGRPRDEQRPALTRRRASRDLSRPRRASTRGREGPSRADAAPGTHCMRAAGPTDDRLAGTNAQFMAKGRSSRSNRRSAAPVCRSPPVAGRGFRLASSSAGSGQPSFLPSAGRPQHSSRCWRSRSWGSSSDATTGPPAGVRVYPSQRPQSAIARVRGQRQPAPLHLLGLLRVHHPRASGNSATVSSDSTSALDR